MNNKPRIFIGSSVESLDIADALSINLDHQAEVTIWKTGTFNLSSSTIDDLITKASSVDFSLFIFSPDDILIIRNQSKAVVRDNVLFELGLFIGAIGKERCFILKPRGVDLHFPTDLLGVTPVDYEPHRSDDNLASAVTYACVLIKEQMKSLGKITTNSNVNTPLKTNKRVDTLKKHDYLLLGELLCTATSEPNGYYLYQIKNNLGDISHKFDLSAIRLERMGYVEKRNECDENGNEYYSYRISSDGIEILLENEDLSYIKEEKQPSQPIQNYTLSNNDLPF